MTKDIIKATKVTINGETNICERITDIWDLIGWTTESAEEEAAKASLLRALFVNGSIDLSSVGYDIQMEIIPVQ